MEDITEEAKKIGELNTAAIRDSIFNRLNENQPSMWNLGKIRCTI